MVIKLVNRQLQKLLINICYSNADGIGDKAIYTASQFLFHKEFSDYDIATFSPCSNYDDEKINAINKANLLILCGGGLLFHDSCKNGISDWQWSISPSSINEIKIPIVVYAIGYSNFRNQREFSSLFGKTINNLSDKAIFFGLRNSGSIKALRKHVKKRNQHNFQLNFCPTLLLNEEFHFRNALDNHNIGFVIAGDRLNIRHQSIPKFVHSIKTFHDYVKKEKYYTYLIVDDNADGWIAEHVNFDEVKNCREMETKEAYEMYSKTDFVIGDRLHSLMIPFACGCRILTPISHNKVKWFLEDLNLEFLGIEEGDLHLDEKLIDAFEHINNLDWVTIHTEKMKMIKETNRKNLLEIHEKLSMLELEN